MCIQRQNREDEGPSWGWSLVARGGWRRTRQALIFFAACVVLLTACSEAFAQNDEKMEYPVKLAFLYNFTKFVEWPADSYRDASAALRICVMGNDPFADDLKEELETRTVGGRRVEIRRLKSRDTLKACQLVFVPATEKKRAVEIVAALNGSSALIVGESAGFIRQGGMINFTVEDNKVHFEVNVDAAERAGLKISSKLLTLARPVKDPRSGRENLR